MHPFVEVALVNALLAIPLAILAMLVSQYARRPALAHCVWLVVVLKLVTPAVWQIPLVDPSIVQRPIKIWRDTIERGLIQSDFSGKSNNFDESATDVPPDESVSRPKVLPQKANTSWDWARQWTLSQLIWIKSAKGIHTIGITLGIFWALGTFLWFSIQAFRCIRFQRMLQRGWKAPTEVEQAMSSLAKEAACSHTPSVWLMPNTWSPMLWSTGFNTRLIFPEAMLERIDGEAQKSLLAHELAHFQRGDHWVRILMLFVTGLFWWHPVVWLARREIETAEEECCDAWVITRARISPRRYADAILETIDFLAEHKSSVPPLATGLGQLPFLRQRLTWIMRGPRKQNLTKFGVALCLTLMAGLPVQPTWVSAHNISIDHEIRESNESAKHVDLVESDDLRDHSDAPAGRVVQEFTEERQSLQTTSSPGIIPNSEIPIVSSNQRFVIYVGDDRQWMVDRIRDRLVDLTSYRIKTAAFSADGRWVATGGHDGFVRLWESEELTERMSWFTTGNPVGSVAISPDGLIVAGGGQDGIVRLWSSVSSELTRELPRETRAISCVRFSPDGCALAVASGNAASMVGGRIVVWDKDDWTERVSMNWNQPTAAISFGRDERTLLSGDWQGRIARWNASTGELLGFVEGYEHLIASAQLSPESSILPEIRVPDLPVSILVGDGRQDEQIRSVWERIARKTSVFTLPFSPKKPQTSP